MTQDAPSTPPAEVEIDERLVRALLQAQHPDLAALSIRFVGAGWDNVMVRLGDHLALRLPRHAVGHRLLSVEQRWLPQLAPHLPLPIPAPLHIGSPGEDYPFCWSIVKWLEGETADLTPPDGTEAPVLSAFLKALHRLDPPSDAPFNPHRGCPLTGKQAATEQRMASLQNTTDIVDETLLSIWRAGLAAPIDLPRTWIAGDVHAQNVLVNDGRLSAFIDWGDMGVGDAATDLASIWMLFGDAEARRDAIAAYGMSEATLARAKGWAVFFGVILYESGLIDSPRHAAVGRATLERLVEDGV